VSHGAINYIAERLTVGPAEAYGVATFYDLLATEPTPERVVWVCDDIACKASGVDGMLDNLAASVGAPGTERAGATWKRSPCLGQCEKGSAAFVQVARGANCSVAPVTAEQVIEILSADAPSRAVAPTPPSERTRLLSGVARQKTLDAYRQSGGYSGLMRAIEMGPEASVSEIVASKIRGRGGAAFPAGIKWEAVASHSGDKYVVCNADESEPGTFKDRVLMEEDPFAVLEGLTIAGIATGSTKGYIYVRGEYPHAISMMQRAIDSAVDAGLLGDRISGTDLSLDIEIRRGAGAYICGEETALFNSVEGYRGEPRQKPPFPTDAGLFGKPTLVNNVETLANVPAILRDGGAAFADIGTGDSTGPKLFCLSGNVARPGIYEVEFGASTRDLIDLAGGVEGSLATVLVGGAAGSFIGGDDLDVPLTFEDTRAANLSLGSGVVMVFNDTIDMMSIIRRIAEFFGEESCGLCVPCRVGTVRQHESLERMAEQSADGSTRDHELRILDDLDQVLRDASICGLGQSASVAVQSALRLDLI